MERQLRERTRLAHELDKPRRGREQALVVPDRSRSGRRGDAPSENLLVGHVDTGIYGSPQRRCCGRESVRSQQSEAVEENVVRTRRACDAKSSDGAGDFLSHTVGGRPSVVGCKPRSQVRLACELGVEGFEPPPGAEQQQRNLVSQTRGEG